jgi:hypothetical protein
MTRPRVTRSDGRSELEQIKALKYRYLRTLDLKQWEDFADCFVPEATGEYPGLSFDSRDALVAYLRENLGPGVLSMHHVHHPEITIDRGGAGDGVGARATGIWYVQDKVLVPDLSYIHEGAGFYTDRYVRTPDGWRIEHTRCRRTYETSWSSEDLPSLRIQRGDAYDAYDD